jgi:hypothetical protein
VTLQVRIDVADIEGLARDAATLDTVTLGRAAVRSVNAVAARGHAEASRRIRSGINLTEAYVHERMVIVEATDPLLPTATIVAYGAKSKARSGINPLASLRRYAPEQETQPVRFPNAAIEHLIGSRGPNPRKRGSTAPWTRRTGDAVRVIPVDQKGAGVSVEVTRGQRKTIKSAFLMPMRAGNDSGAGGLGVFTRNPGFKRREKGALRLRLGPSVYQLFRRNASQMVPDLQADLQRTTEAEVRAAIEGVLG